MTPANHQTAIPETTNPMRVLAVTVAPALLVLLTACMAGGEAAPSAPAVPVTVATLRAQALTVTEDFPARVAAVRVAEIRPQVSGIVQRRLFMEGAEVSQGQPLFALHSAPFKAEAAVAAAALQRAEAALARADAQVRRLSPLVDVEAVSRQAFDDAQTDRALASADASQARATLERRQLDVAFSTVAAPIAGRIEQALQSEGALVSASDATPLARILQIDQVYVDVRQPAAALAPLRRQLESSSNETRSAGLPVTVLQAGGEAMDVNARALFSGISVDASTGDVLLRALVQNPRRALLPGMFVRARIPMASYAAALLVPQQAVIRGAKGSQVWVLSSADGKVRRVDITVAELVNGHYRVSEGLRAGESVVVSNVDRLVEGATVQLVAAAN